MMQLQSNRNRRPLSLHLNEVDITEEQGEAKWDWAEMDADDIMGRVRRPRRI